MFDQFDIPSDLSEQAVMLEGILVARATGGASDENAYVLLRREFISNQSIQKLLPKFVRSYRSLDAFWPFIKNKAPTYAERREIINQAFTPLIDFLEGNNVTPTDQDLNDVLVSFDAAGVEAVWAKAIARRDTDPEGAITVARTLLEAVMKHILERRGLEFADKDDLPKLYSKVSGELNLAPNQHTEIPIKSILGGVVSVVGGIGTLRNRLSDSHGRGGNLPVKPSRRHATLAVNTAGAIAVFLIETFNERQ